MLQGQNQVYSYRSQHNRPLQMLPEQAYGKQTAQVITKLLVLGREYKN